MLNLQKEGKIIAKVREGGRFTLPNGDVVSPALEGWRNEDGYDLVEAPTPEPPAPVPPAIADVRAEGGRRFALLAATYSAEERETWGKQEEQARAYLADPEAPTPMLDGLLRVGEDKGELAAYIVATAAAREAASAAILGAQRALMVMDPIPADYADDKWWP